MGGGHDIRSDATKYDGTMVPETMPNRAKTGSLRRGAVYRARGKVKGLSACKATGCKATG